MDIVERFFEYADRNRVRVYSVSAATAACIAYADWLTPGVSLGFLFVVPILLASGLFNVQHVVAASVIAAVLREEFNPVHWLGGTDASRWDFNLLRWHPDSYVRMAIGFAGFSLVGYCVSELNMKRRITLRHLKERDEQIQLRQAAEQQVRILIETSPLAILTLDEVGRVLLANRSAAELLGFDAAAIEGADIRSLLPVLGRILKTEQPVSLRTTVECKAQRRDGEVFLAHIWLSTYSTAAGANLAAVIWDASENLRDKEDTGLDSMMATSRVVIGAVSHEVRNLASAAIAAYKELRTLPGPGKTEPLNALGSILQGIERIASSGLAMASDRESAVTELGTVLDEARIVIEPGIREAGGKITWRLPAHLPLVQADHHGLLQVFLNLARNSQAAIESASVKELTVEVSAERDVIAVRFRDTGGGVLNPDELFKPFHPGANSAGLGLYISRAILRAHGGDLSYEPDAAGSCFTVELWPIEDRSR